MSTLAGLWTEHEAAERECVRAALVARGWSLRGAARALGVQVSTLQRVLARHPEVEAERQRNRTKTVPAYAGA